MFDNSNKQKRTGNQIRQIWIDFFSKNDHYFIESKSLVPKNDPSLLWINAGVATLKDYFSGKTYPPAPRLVSSQRCLRTNDIERVGMTSRHQTLFEMLGNFSIGNYFKKEAIFFAYDLLINYYHLDQNRLYFTVFENDNETYEHWINLGIKPDHLVRGNRDRNFWDLGSGPCGPCTEIFYDRGDKYDPEKKGIDLFIHDLENDRYVEIWNIVFSQFNNDGKNNYTELIQKNIDTGSGFERLVSILQDVPTNFDTDLFLPIIREIENHTNKKYNVDDYFLNDVNKHQQQAAFRIIADHLKACVFAIADGVLPSPKERGYIIRRLLRRALIYAYKLGITNNFFEPVVQKIIALYQDFFPHLVSQNAFIINVLKTEEQMFKTTINHGLGIFNNAIKEQSLNGQVLFKLVETYGFPIELIKELANDQKVKLNWQEFQTLFKTHQETSKNKNNVPGIEKQNDNLLAFEKVSTFDYHANSVMGKVIGLFDDQLQSVSQIVNGSGYVVFDQTVIYATSGGQRFDEGYATKGDQKVKFDNVLKAPHLQHLHHFEKASFAIGEVWEVSHDVKWRRLVAKNHTLEHVMHAALKRIIGPSIKQEGAFKSAYKATLDFSYPTRLSDEQLTAVEDEIRHIIENDLPVEVIYTSLEESKKMNAIAYFEDEYKKHNQVRVIKIGDYSVELCGGTHLNKTSQIEECYIFNYGSQGSGSWRIEIISSFETTNAYLQEKMTFFKQKIKEFEEECTKTSLHNKELNELLTRFELPKTIRQLRQKTRDFEKISQFYMQAKIEHDKKNRENKIEVLKKQFIANIQNHVSINFLNNQITSEINSAITNATNEEQDIVCIVFNQVAGKLQYMVGKKTENKDLNAKIIVQSLNQKLKGKGGGNNHFAQGGTVQVIDQKEILKILKTII